MEKKYLLFDYGASHGRCIVGKFDGSNLDMEVIFDFENRPVAYAGTLYWDILRLASELKLGMQKAFSIYPDIACVGIDTWGCDFGFIDKDGSLLANPANYRDALRHTYKKQLDAAFGEYNLYAEAGANTNPIMGLYHLYGLKHQNASHLQAAGKLLMIPDLLNYYLTGIAANEYTDATMFLGVNQAQKKWSKKIIDFCGFNPDWFCELRMPGTVLGEISKGIAEEFGIPQIPVITVASHDSASAVAGMPISQKDAARNWSYLSLGTWALLGMESEEMYNCPRALPTGFATQGGCAGKNNFVNLITGLWVIQQCAEKWKQKGNFSWDSVVESARAAGRSNAYFSHDDERFAFPTPDMPGLLQGYFRETGQPVPEGMGGIAACVYENLVYILREAYDNLCRFTGRSFEVLQVVGGGSNNALLCQWIADALGLTVKAGPSETTSLGNMLLQMQAMGDIGSLAEGRDLAASSFAACIYEPCDCRDRWDEGFSAYMQRCAKK